MQMTSTTPRRFRSATVCLLSMMLAASPMAATAQTNSAPVAEDDSDLTLAHPVMFGPYGYYADWCTEVLANDSDPDQDPIEIINATVTTDPTEYGSMAYAYGWGSGSRHVCYYYYSPSLNSGDSFTITYTISDGQGGQDTAELAISISN